MIDEKEYADLATNPVFSTKDFKGVPAKYRTLIPEYIKGLCIAESVCGVIKESMKAEL